MKERKLMKEMKRVEPIAYLTLYSTDEDMIYGSGVIVEKREIIESEIFRLFQYDFDLDVMIDEMVDWAVEFTDDLIFEEEISPAIFCNCCEEPMYAVPAECQGHIS